MKKYLIAFLLFSISNIFSQKSDGFSIKLVSKKICENKNACFEIQNNSDKEYYFLIDTSFINLSVFTDFDFLNPSIVMYDANKKEVEMKTIVRDYKQSENKINKNFENDINQSENNFCFLKFNPKETKMFKIKFQLYKRIGGESFEFLNINKKENYFASVNYILKKEHYFLNALIKKHFKNKKETDLIFYGNIKSNEVPVEFKEQPVRR